MNMMQSGLADLYENVERRLGNKAWILPIAVGLGSFFWNKKMMHRSTPRALLSGALTGVSAAGLLGAGHTAKDQAPIA